MPSSLPTCFFSLAPLFFFCLGLVSSAPLLVSRNKEGGTFPVSPSKCFTTWEEAVAVVSGKSNSITLLVTNAGYLDMTQNLNSILTNIGVSNFLVIATSGTTADLLEKNRVPCYQWKGTEFTVRSLSSVVPIPWKNIEEMNKADWFGVGAFPILTKLRHFFTYEILIKGINVLTIDSDVVLLRDPYRFFENEIDNAHLWFQQDDYKELWRSKNISFLAPNAGFIFAKASSVSVHFYERFLDLMRYNMTRESDQQVVWFLLSEEGYLERGEAKLLPQDLFPVLPVFKKALELGRYKTETPYIVHFCWLMGKLNKIHALRENSFWFIDPPEYFTGRYIMLRDNQVGWTSLEAATLLSLSRLLGRIPILPWRTVPMQMGIELIQPEFEFRASSFYEDPRFLRGRTKHSVTLFINHQNSSEYRMEMEKNRMTLKFPHNSCGLKADQLLEYLNSPTAQQFEVLQLENPTKVFSGFGPDEGTQLADWRLLLKKILKHTIYNEWRLGARTSGSVVSKREQPCWWWGTDLITKWEE